MARVLAFGPFRLDRKTSMLSREGVMTPLSPKLVQVLACLVEARGALVTRDLLLERHWPGLTVTDNTLTRAVADIRKVLGDDASTPAFVQTVARRGYRFLAPVREEIASPDAVESGAAAVTGGLLGLEPFVAWEQGRAALESLHVDALPAAAAAFSRAVAGAPHYAAAYAGPANVHIFRFEATRVDNTPLLEALDAAAQAAQRATALDPTLGEGWAALGHALSASGRADEARGALRQAVALEPQNWRHHYRMAVTSWGEERLRAVERADALLPGFPGAQTASAMVFLARQALDAADAAATRGAAAQSAQHDRSLYPSSGLLWIRGLVSAARGDLPGASRDFAAEARFSAHTATVYARECRLAAAESLGFARLLDGDRDGASTAFGEAFSTSSGHGRAVLGLAVAAGASAQALTLVETACRQLDASGKRSERTLVLAAAHGWSGAPAVGLDLIDEVLTADAPSPSGWSLPAEPMFAPLRAADGYARLAARLAARAA